MKTASSSPSKATEADSSAPAADRPATASNVEMPQPTVVEDPEARTLLASDRFAEEVRAREQFYLQQGIHSVPAIVINDRHLLQGGQPVEVFEQALRQIAAAEDFAI